MFLTRLEGMSHGRYPTALWSSADAAHRSRTRLRSLTSGAPARQQCLRTNRIGNRARDRSPSKEPVGGAAAPDENPTFIGFRSMTP